MFLLRCSVKNYEWGKKGEQSFVAQLCKSSDSSFQIENKPYAEMWMGTHPSGPSVIIGPEQNVKDMLLSKWIQLHPECLGETIIKQFGSQLPFLFKVLSVSKPLSIQAHPDIIRAQKLHKKNPSAYPDPNHKPEMAIALTEFEALCGFRPLIEIQNYLKQVEELSAVCGKDDVNNLIKAHVDNYQTALKSCFTSLMKCQEERLQQQLKLLVSRFSSLKDDNIASLFIRIHSHFPGDVGCFALFFLNYLILKPGEALFLAANEPHAYLLGDCIECMACSDNVVRAGLTPKFKDVDTLCSMLTYTSKTPSQTLFKPLIDCARHCRRLFAPAIPDFSVLEIRIPVDCKEYMLEPLESASILLVIEGNALCSCSNCREVVLQKGSVIFISVGETVNLKIMSNGMLLFSAYCP